MNVSKEANNTRREYYRKYREKNAERLRAYKRAWNAENKDKLAEHQRRYWEKRAAEQAITPEK